jgi:hypothetical protein
MSRMPYKNMVGRQLPFEAERIRIFLTARVSMRFDPSRVALLADVCHSLAGQGAASLNTSETKAPHPPRIQHVTIGCSGKWLPLLGKSVRFVMKLDRAQMRRYVPTDTHNVHCTINRNT